MHDAALPKQQKYLWALDGAVLLSLAVLILYTASKHEPWADEAQAWLIARDVPWWQIVTEMLRYEGHPPLWFGILAAAIHVFHMPYAYLAYLGSTFAIAGLAVLLFLAPFPRILRYAIAGSFFFVYHYAVVARPYVLVPLLGFLAAHFYRKGPARVLPFAVAIALLIQDSSYGAMMACGFSAFYGMQLAKRWKSLPTGQRRQAGYAGALIVGSLMLAFVILLPKPDATLVLDARHQSFAERIARLGEGVNGAFTDMAPLTILLLLLSCIWAFRRSALLLLMLVVGSVSLEYGFLRGFGHHQGLITIAFVVFLWAAWPTNGELEEMERFQQYLQHAFVVALLVLFGWQWTWSYSSIRGDWAGPYSGAQDAAQFLKAVNADRMGCAGYMYWAVGVQPYFDHNIFLNYGGPGAPARYRFSVEFEQRAGRELTDRQIAMSPPFIVFAPEVRPEQLVNVIEMFRSLGYVLVHYSPGTRYFKNGTVPASYYIFEQVNFLASTAARGR